MDLPAARRPPFPLSDTLCLAYPARVEREEGGYAVTFRDVPQARSRGATPEDARQRATEALAVAVACHVDAYRPVPDPSAPLPQEELVPLPRRLSVLVAALNESIALGVNEQVFLRLAAQRLAADTAPSDAASDGPAA